MKSKTETKEQRQRYNRDSYQRNKDKRKAYAEAHKRDRKNNSLRYYFGLSITEYETMLEQQDGRCAICRCVPEGSLCVDHNHTTGKIRGLLCTLCNTGLGRFKDNVELVRKAVAYLETYDADI